MARQVEFADQDRAVSRDAGPLLTDDDHPEGVASWIECAQDQASRSGPERGHDSLGEVVSWIECSKDKRSWVWVYEEELRKEKNPFIVPS